LQPSLLPATAILALTVVLVVSVPAAATFPGRNGDIVFAARPPNQPRGLFRIDVDGKRVTRVTPRGTYEDIAAAWSPDGTTLAFTSDRSGDRDIWSMNPGSGEPPVNLTGTPADAEWLPTWSPDGRIAFITDLRGSGGFTVDVIDADGGNRVTVASPGSRIFGVEWSPRGNRIVFGVANGRRTAIDAVRPDGSGLTRWANALSHAVIYDWRSDGRWVLYQGEASGRRALFEIASAGEHRIRRLTGPRPVDRDQHGAYAPSGEKAVFVRTRPVGDELWMVRSDGTHERRMRALHRMRLFGVTWQPLPRARRAGPVPSNGSRGRCTSAMTA
jgi:Tol biopolymer transport system component